MYSIAIDIFVCEQCHYQVYPFNFAVANIFYVFDLCSKTCSQNRFKLRIIKFIVINDDLACYHTFSKQNNMGLITQLSYDATHHTFAY